MLLLEPSIFHGIIGLFVIGILAASLIAFPAIFAEESPNIWKIRIMEGASNSNPSHIFYPNELPASLGDTIEWINEDSITHSITSGAPNFPDHYGHFFNPGIVEPGESVSITLDNSDFDAFYYLCEIHPWMTGKLFTSEAFVAQPETESPITVEKKSYEKGEMVFVSGKVHKDFWGTDFQILVYDESQELVDVVYGYFDDDAEYSEVIDTSKNLKVDGDYQLKLVYALPSKVAKINFEFNSNSMVDAKSIPVWVKNIGQFWCSNQINDSEFVNAIQFLISDQIIKVTSKNLSGSDEFIPKWVKSSACWWSENQISDVDFLSGIEYLVNKGTIRV
jgi:plastocyanin